MSTIRVLMGPDREELPTYDMAEGQLHTVESLGEKVVDHLTKWMDKSVGSNFALTIIAPPDQDEVIWMVEIVYQAREAVTVTDRSVFDSKVAFVEQSLGGPLTEEHWAEAIVFDGPSVLLLGRKNNPDRLERSRPYKDASEIYWTVIKEQGGVKP